MSFSPSGLRFWELLGNPGKSIRGGEGNRTPGLFDATEALYQLSYTPDWKSGRIYLRGLTADPGSPAAPYGADLLVRRTAQTYSFAVRRIMVTVVGAALAWGM